MKKQTRLLNLQAKNLKPGDYIYHMGHWRDIDVIHNVGSELRIQLGPRSVMIKTFVSYSAKDNLQIHRIREVSHV